MLITGVLGAFAGEFRLGLKCSCVSAHLVRRTLGGMGSVKVFYWKEEEGRRLAVLLQGVPRNMTVGEYFKMSSSIIF